MHPSDHDPYASILLRQFLDNCQRRGWLSTGERQLLTQFKLDGVSCTELARRNGHSVVAIRHRIQRLLDRLRRIAQTSDTQSDYRFDIKTFMELRNAQSVVTAYDGVNPTPPMFCYLKPYYNDPNDSYFVQLTKGQL